jgi:hypothetical protein
MDKTYEWVLQTVDSESFEILDSVFCDAIEQIVDKTNENVVLDAIEGVLPVRKEKDGTSFYQLALVVYFGYRGLSNERHEVDREYVYVKNAGLCMSPLFPELSAAVKDGIVLQDYLEELLDQYSKMVQETMIKQNLSE